MTIQSYTTSYSVDQSSAEVFSAINDVRGWWSGEIEGDTDSLGEEFTYRYEDIHYSKQKITEFVPNEKIVWHIVDSYLKFVDDQSEWNDTEVIFDVSTSGDQTVVTFTHQGLVPAFECFDACSNAWGFYINESLRNLIVTGKGDPNS
ncbi:MAG: SRPBCC domain-containing protein [Acidimicrobiales bacterium]